MLKILKLFFVLSFFVTFSYASKIVSVGGSITETVVALGHSNELIGVDLSKRDYFKASQCRILD